MLNFDKWLLLVLGIHGYRLRNALDYHYFFRGSFAFVAVRLVCEFVYNQNVFFLMNIDQHMDFYFSIMGYILKYLRARSGTGSLNDDF